MVGTFSINFRKTVQPLTAEHQEERIPVSGYIKEIITHFPPGCNSLIGIRIFLNGKQILPQVGVVALDGATERFAIIEQCKKGDWLRVDWENHDDTYSHTVSIIVNGEGHES